MYIDDYTARQEKKRNLELKLAEARELERLAAGVLRLLLDHEYGTGGDFRSNAMVIGIAEYDRARAKADRLEQELLK